MNVFMLHTHTHYSIHIERKENRLTVSKISILFIFEGKKKLFELYRTNILFYCAMI